MKKISMNLYYNPMDLLGKSKKSLIQDVFNRFYETDFNDLFCAICDMDPDIFDMIDVFIEDASEKELEQYITVNENSFQYDISETQECDAGIIAFLIDVNFDVEKLINKLMEEEKEI